MVSVYEFGFLAAGSLFSLLYLGVLTCWITRS